MEKLRADNRKYKGDCLALTQSQQTLRKEARVSPCVT
jgi:hypothetical protein